MQIVRNDDNGSDFPGDIFRFELNSIVQHVTNPRPRLICICGNFQPVELDAGDSEPNPFRCLPFVDDRYKNGRLVRNLGFCKCASCGGWMSVKRLINGGAR